MPEIAASVTSSAESQKCHRTALTVEALARSFLDNLLFVQGRSLERATVNDLYMALAHTVRDRLVERWISTVKNYQAQDVRVVCYLSAEFLTGPHLANNLINLGIYDETEQAMRQLGLDLNRLSNRKKSLASAMAAWAAWPPVSWIRWPRSIFLPSATAFATNTASSTSKFATAGRWNRPTSGCGLAIPGRWSGPKMPLK